MFLHQKVKHRNAHALLVGNVSLQDIQRMTRTYDTGFSLLRVSQRAQDGEKEKGEGLI